MLAKAVKESTSCLYVTLLLPRELGLSSSENRIDILNYIASVYNIIWDEMLIHQLTNLKIFVSFGGNTDMYSEEHFNSRYFDAALPILPIVNYTLLPNIHAVYTTCLGQACLQTIKTRRAELHLTDIAVHISPIPNLALKASNNLTRGKFKDATVYYLNNVNCTDSDIPPIYQCLAVGK